MSVEIFTTQEFEEVLTRLYGEHGYRGDGVIGGEFRYSVPISEDPFVRIYINSSIEFSGFSSDTGQNSIRVWVGDEQAKPLANKLQKYVTRVTGWQERLQTVLEASKKIADHIRKCPTCGKTEKVFMATTAKNSGRLFRKCCKFSWIDQESTTQKSPQTPTVSKSSVICPKCGKGMILRNGKFGEFYGCSGFPTCRTTIDASQIPTGSPQNPTASDNSVPQKPVVWQENFTPSIYQQAIYDHAKIDAHLVVEACAGSGKTSTIRGIWKRLDPTATVLSLAYNRHIAKTLAESAPSHVKVSTTHSIGYAELRKANPDMDHKSLQTDKVKKIFKSICNWDTNAYKFPVVDKIVSMVKSTLWDTDDSSLNLLCNHYNIELPDRYEEIFDLVRQTLQKCLENSTVIDFDDMLWLPVMLDLNCETYDYVLVDEAQDLNACQLALIAKFCGKETKAIFVGDRYQSMYGFRGADVDAIPNIIESFHAETLPLSISYRCPKAVVRYVNQEIPEVPFEMFDNGVEGSVNYVPTIKFLNKVKDGDMVLCRTNAPLVPPVLQLIRSGVKAVIVGRDVADGLKKLVDKLYKSEDIVTLLQALKDYETMESVKLYAMGKKNQAIALSDTVDTLSALSDGCVTVSDLLRRIDTVFSSEAEGVSFSTVHRAKGLEADNVWILRNDLMPHPMASEAWELEQERNIRYVAFSRAKSTLNFVE